MTTSSESDIFVHEKGICESLHIGKGTRVWAFAHVLPGARIGKDCNVCDHVFIENDVIVGDEVTLKCGVQLWDGVRLGDRVFIGPNATFTNDLVPRSKRYPEHFLTTVLEDDVSVGANATILPGITIGRGAMIGAGAVITRNVPPFATVVGNPGRIIGYQNTPVAGELTSAVAAVPSQIGARVDLGVRNCWVERLPHFADMRGSLTPLQSGKGLPFTPRRIFMVYGVSSHLVRGEHAHRQCEQFLIAAHGSVSVVVDDGKNRQEIRLEDPTVGLYLAPMVWGIQYKFDPDCVLMVAASHEYEAEDYIRNYADFLAAVSEVE